MIRKNREINIFSVSVLDLFASAMGAFILLFVILLPYYLKTNPELIKKNQALQQENQQLQAQNQNLQQQLQQCQEQTQSLQGQVAQLQEQNQQLQQQAQSLQQQLQDCQARNQALERQVAELQAQNQALQQQAQNQQQVQQQLQSCEEARRKAEGRAASCEEKLKYTFLAVAIQWRTSLQDVDMHLVDPAGHEFWFRANNLARREFPGVDAELSLDSQIGPGVELWQTPNAARGIYKVYVTLYDRHCNMLPESQRSQCELVNPTISSAVYFRDGSKKPPEVTLTDKEAKLIATIVVKEDGNVEVR